MFTTHYCYNYYNDVHNNLFQARHQSVLCTLYSNVSLYLQALLAEFCLAAEEFTVLDPVGVGSDEMFVGRAGYIAGCLWLHQALGKVNTAKHQKYFYYKVL